MRKAQERENTKAQESCPNLNAPNRNQYYARQSRKDQESFSDIVSGMLQLFSIIVYALFDSVATLSFVKTLEVMKFDIIFYI